MGLLTLGCGLGVGEPRWPVIAERSAPSPPTASIAGRAATTSTTSVAVKKARRMVVTPAMQAAVSGEPPDYSRRRTSWLRGLMARRLAPFLPELARRKDGRG